MTVSAEWAVLCERRAGIYAWFSSVFAVELTPEAVAAYQRGDARSLLDAFAHMGLESQSERVRRAIAAWEGMPFLREELAADFARLFLLDVRDAAIPYASAYLDPAGRLYGEPHAQMRRLLHENGLQVDRAFKEPADHLAVMLAAFEAQLLQAARAVPAQEAAARQQADTLQTTLLSWLPEFNRRCQQLSGQLASDFYPALADLLLAFMGEDVASLEAASTLS